MSIFKKKNRPVKLGQAKKKLFVRREARHIVIMLAAVTLQALSILWFYRPAGIVSGGITGISMLLNYATGGNIQSWIPMVVLNAPLLYLAYRELHLKFVIYTTISTLYFSLIFAVFENLPPVEIFDMTNPVMPLISTIFGAVLNGVFGAVIIRQGSSTGGFQPGPPSLGVGGNRLLLPVIADGAIIAKLPANVKPRRVKNRGVRVCF